MIKLESLAKDIQAKLEDISFELYEDDNSYPQFNITDDIQIYQNRKLKKSGRRFTPGIIRQMPGMMSPDQQWGVYTSQFQLELYGYRDERHKIKEIFREFIKNYNGLEYTPEPGYDVIDNNKIGVMALGNFIIEDFTSSDDGLDESGFIGYIDIVISVFVGGLSAKETSLKIEGIEVPFDEVQYKQDKSLIPNIEYKNKTDDPNMENKLVYELLTFNLPLNISTELDQLILERALNPTYNDLFTIEWNLGIGVKSGQYVLRSAFIQYNQLNEAIGVLVSFENTSNIQTILIDDEIVPILQFDFSSVRGTNAFNTQHEDGNIEVLQSSLTYSYGISMTILYDPSIFAVRSIRNQLIKNDLDTSHTITIRTEEEEIEYNVILTEGSWQFNERANQVLQVAFVGEKIF